MNVIRVGPLELDPQERRLLVAGEPVEIGARAFDLLRVLAEHPGRLVTKATLLDRVWPRLIVDENNLPTQVAAVRRAVGPDLIRTVPGFGYRLDVPDAVAAATPPPVPVSHSPARRLPAPRLSPLLGRTRDLAALTAQLQRSRLVTIVGMPGIGKTRLAEEILTGAMIAPADRSALIPLAPLGDIAAVPPAIATAFGCPLPPNLDPLEALERAIGDGPALLVLDCAEHLENALAGMLASLMGRAPGLRTLVTSQAPVGIDGEVVYRLDALELPAPGATVVAARDSAAVALFAQRAMAADRGFVLDATTTPIVAEICRRLDGNPLALELAAARVPALGVAVLRERLDDRLRLLRSRSPGRDDRHAALQAAFEWSHGLLEPQEQRVFNWIGAFAGTFGLKDAAACVATADFDEIEAVDVLARLVDRSLVSSVPADPPRYVLSETARCFALDRLAVGHELERARASVARTMLATMDAAYRDYWIVDEARWRQQYLPDLDNVRAAMSWALESDAALAVALYGSSWPLFIEAELAVEGRTSYDAMVRLLREGLPLSRVGRFWEAAASFFSTGRCDRARYAAELAARMHGETGDVRARYYALSVLVLNWRADHAAARAAFDEARLLEDASWPPRLLTHGALTEAGILMAAGEFAGARESCRRAVRLALSVSERQALAATVRVVELDLACGDPAAALQIGRPLALSLRHTSHHAMRLDLMVLVLGALLEVGDIAEARAAAASLHDLARRMDPGCLYAALDAMSLLACLEGRHEAGARVALQADRAYSARGLERRRPHESRLQAAALRLIECHLGTHWRSLPCGPDADDAHACALALGIEA